MGRVPGPGNGEATNPDYLKIFGWRRLGRSPYLELCMEMVISKGMLLLVK